MWMDPLNVIPVPCPLLPLLSQMGELESVTVFN